VTEIVKDNFMQKLSRNFTPRLLTLLLTLALSAFIFTKAHALEKTNRLGVGMTNQLKNDFPALSFKMQKNRSFAYGGMAGISTSDTNGGYGVGLKIYRNIFDEPQLNFYMAGAGALLSNKVAGVSKSGFQIDLSFGSEFHFTGLNSLGFSVEFGVSANKKGSFVFETLGNNFIVSGVHFYL
jgi:hypothetical protein